MPLFTDTERPIADALSRLLVSNPFLPERIENERMALGRAFVELDPEWNVDVESGARHPNLVRLQELAEGLIRSVRGRAPVDGLDPADAERFEAIVLLLLYYRYRDRLSEVLKAEADQPGVCPPVRCYADFERDAHELVDVPGLDIPIGPELPHLFACCCQVRPHFLEIFNSIIGMSRSIVGLRAEVWQSVFSHDMLRYRRVLYRSGSDLTTLIMGPSGTGKELVARAVALSHYIPFDPATHTFAENYTDLFHALNISALSPTLVESELFGHRKGAFTGAVADRAGWLEQCSAHGSVFLDEVGELDAQIQVKLLRVLHSRVFQPIGSSEPRYFPGKIIAATNRDLEREIAAGRFRTDFYYRLCSDIIRTPTLKEQIRDNPEQLSALLSHIARRVIGDDEADALAREVEAWIHAELGPDYDWPGNVRELEQCLRNVMVRKEYRPISLRARRPREELARAVVGGSLTADELIARYCTLVYAETGSYEKTAERLGLDRRTVKKRIDEAFLERCRLDGQV